jgi:hypothetical protein
VLNVDALANVSETDTARPAHETLDDPAASPERVVEYGVNVTDGTAFPWNPFDRNFPAQPEADDAARQYLMDNPDLQSAEVFEMVIEDNQIVSDTILSTFHRDDMAEVCAP